MNLSPHSGLHVPPSSLDIKSPQKFPPKAAGATELETASSCMPEIESKGRGCRNFESRAKDKPFEERRRNQKTNVWRFPNFHLHIAGNCLNECQLQTLSLSDPSLAARGMAEFAADSHQFGNGFRLDLRNSPIEFRMVGRRWWSVSTSRSRPIRSPSYHSSGIPAAHCRML